MKTLKENTDPSLEAANIRPIPKVFEREGTFRHELQWKDGPYAIYRYHFLKTEFNPPRWKYEAVIIRIMNPHPKGTDQRLREALPSNSDWGNFGWSFNTLEKAQEQIAKERITRGEVIESNYFAYFKNGFDNSRNDGGETSNTILTPSEAHKPQF